MMASLTTGFVFVSSWAALDLMPDSDATRAAKKSNDDFGDFLRLFPSFALGQGFVKLSLAPVLRFVGGDGTAAAQVAPSMTLMSLFPLYLAAIFVAEWFRRTRTFRDLRGSCCCGSKKASADAEAGSRIVSAPRAWALPAPNAADAFRVERLSVRYPTSARPQHIFALDAASCSIPAHAVTCVVGASAAGKSTLIRQLAGMELPTAGTVTAPALAALGLDPDVFHSHATLSKATGLMLDRGDGLERSLTPYLLMHIMCDLRGLRVTEGTNLHVFQVLRDLGVYSVRNAAIGTLSSTTRSRVGVAAAVVGYPRTVLLDEPTSGMDPVHRRIVWDALRSLPIDTTVVVTTSDAVEAARYAEHIVTLERGVCTYSGAKGAWPAKPKAMLALSLRHAGEHSERQHQRSAAIAAVAPYVVASDADAGGHLHPNAFKLEGDPRSSTLHRPVEAGKACGLLRSLHEERERQPPNAELLFSVTFDAGENRDAAQ
jgi:ABC-type multidrug transport system ATPase subunit